ncbi:MAG: HepT-like ribonuclease domain-containing protein [Raoultibacter sp.]
MRRSERDIDQLSVILRYCQRLDSSPDRFGHNYSAFLLDEMFQDSCSLCLIQIGEAVNRLSEEFKEAHSEIAWSRIYGMRCHLVHGYEMFDEEIAWDAITNEIPLLHDFCVAFADTSL